MAELLTKASMKQIQMVDLISQYKDLKPQIDLALEEVMSKAQFINGPAVKDFAKNLSEYLKVKHVIPCGNGTDALQIALMALDLKPGDEVIVPAFTYVATAEVIGLLGFTPIMVDVDLDNFFLLEEKLRAAITKKTKAIVPVHLFGQTGDMETVLAIAKEYNLFVIEDNAQAIGGDFIYKDGRKTKTGTIGDIGCTSFYPSKNLGCYGDGGAIFTNNDELAQKIIMIANHGQNKKYYHQVLGCNSRLDTMQAAVLNIKLPHLNTYCDKRNQVADHYDQHLGSVDGLIIPKRSIHSTHVFHQYTLRVLENKRDQLAVFLKEAGIPNMIYYPVPLHKQEAFKDFYVDGTDLSNTERLCTEVISLPMHPELEAAQLDFICTTVKKFFE